ncbi:hypothetical protein I6G82_10630 [Lysinibacillus macroides]|uniref:Uncharacterized protein n=1 Tax=Lysinibacillus macroides TaxID=33935 RepID=A0A0N0CUX6_9BACI|nr:hypothetical protein [Lysinibacillus macroides]KOY80845.1 hypothetical protein ADM90_16840 [Lysinibacillus macroides]QPR69987.1 hypothetical protein I6G82_10630 [Lysinibacillus macroides]
MRKYFKVLLAFSVIFIIGIFNFNIGYAQAEEQISDNIDNTFEMYELKNTEEDNNIITPFATFWGNSGTAEINYMPTARAFAWSLNIPGTSGKFLSFTCRADIYTQSTGAFKGSMYFSGGGTGFSISGLADINGVSLTKGVSYLARFTGEAVESPSLKVHYLSPLAYSNGVAFMY